MSGDTYNAKRHVDEVAAMATKIVPITELRRNTSRVVRAVKVDGDVVHITRNGRPAAVILDCERYQTLLDSLEDLSDLIELIVEVDEPARSYEEFLADVATADVG